MTTINQNPFVTEIKERIGSLDVRDNIERRAYEIALASIEAEAIAWKWRLVSLFDSAPIGPWRVCLAPLSPGKGNGCKTEAIPLYASQPVLVDHDALAGKSFEYIANKFQVPISEAQWVLVGWNSCRNAMLQAGNSPVIPDGWISCSERMPEDETTVHVADGRTGITWIADFGDGDFYPDEFPGPRLAASEITHWMPLPEPPQEMK